MTPPNDHFKTGRNSYDSLTSISEHSVSDMHALCKLLGHKNSCLVLFFRMKENVFSIFAIPIPLSYIDIKSAFICKYLLRRLGHSSSIRGRRLKSCTGIL